MIKVNTKYAREVVYVISCLEQNSGNLLFFGLDDYSKLMFPLGIYQSFNDEIYEQVVNTLLEDETFKQGLGKFKLVVGFGEGACKKLEPKIKALQGEIVYDPDLAINSSWEFIQQAMNRVPMMNIKPVSLTMNKVDTWTMFLDRKFISEAIAIPKQLSITCQELLADFKQQFPTGLDHVALVDLKTTKRTMAATQAEILGLLAELPNIQAHNGIIYLDIGNGYTSDFVYRFTHFEGGVNIVCFRLDPELGRDQTSVVICSFNKQGSMLLHTPSGKEDGANTAKLISMVMRNGSVLKDITVNYNKDAVGINEAALDLIPVAKYLYVSSGRG